MQYTKKFFVILMLGLTLAIAGCGREAAVEADAPEATEMAVR